MFCVGEYIDTGDRVSARGGGGRGDVKVLRVVMASVGSVCWSELIQVIG